MRALSLILLAATLAACERGERLPGRYAFLDGRRFDAREVRAALPYDSIALDRTGCYGTCPAYTVVLRKDARAEYRGDAYVERLGTWRGATSLGVFARVSYLLDRFLATGQPHAYDASWTDDATATVRAYPSRGGKPIVIRDYGEVGPPALWTLRSAIDAAASGIHWQAPPDTPADSAAAEAPISGTWALDGGAHGHCTLAATGDRLGWTRFQIYCMRGPPSHNMGEVTGDVRRTGGLAVYRAAHGGMGECHIALAFGYRRVSVAQAGSDAACGLGAGVYVDGTYTQVDTVPAWVPDR